MFELKSPDFEYGSAIPTRYTCDAADEPPSLSWSGEPPATKSFALIMEDPDAPRGVWSHWLLWNIPRSTHSLDRNNAPPAISGVNDFGRSGYGGPCPPRGHGVHRYFFHIYALDVEQLPLRPQSHRKDVERAIHQHVLAEASYMGHYVRQSSQPDIPAPSPGT